MIENSYMENQTAQNIPQPTAVPASAPTPPPVSGGKPWFKTPKIIFVILAVIVLVEVGFTLMSLSKAKTTPPPPKPVKDISGGSISLSAVKTVFKSGDKIPVSIKVSTGGHPTDGTDLVLNYDPRILIASGSAITNGKIYPEYPISNVDNKLGVVRISGISSVSQSGFNGSGLFATINFTAKTAGKTKITVDFKKGQTTDSNIVEAKTAKDILNSVVNLDVTIK